MEVQCRYGHCDPNRIADRQSPPVVDQILARPDPHCVTVKAARIRALYNLSTQYKTAVAGLIERAQPRFLAAKMGVDGHIAGPMSASVGGAQRGSDFDAVAGQLPVAAHPQRHDVGCAHKARDTRKRTLARRYAHQRDWKSTR